MATTKYRLYYFDSNGAAEPARMLFALAGVEFEDIRYKWKSEEWINKYKPMSPFGQCPWLEIDDGTKVITLAQTHPLTHYLAGKFGFCGETPEEEALILMIAETIRELIQLPIYGFCLNPDEQSKRDARFKQYITEQLPTAFTYLERYLTSNQGEEGWFVGEKMSWADVMFTHWIQFMPHGISHTPSLDNYPKLQRIIHQVEALPRYADWIKRRPDTNMKMYPDRW